MKRVIVIIALFSVPVWAGRKEGVQQEYRAVEEAIRNKQTGPEARLKTLETNLVNAVRLAMTRHYYEERETITKDLSIQTIEYENPTSPLVYFVKYKNSFFRFEYARNPESFAQSPITEKFLDAAEVDMTHRESSTNPTAPATPAQPAKTP